MKHPLPEQELLGELQLCLIPIIHELPLLQSLVKWIKKTSEGQRFDHPMGWMLLSDETWSTEKQVEKLLKINHSVKELGKPLSQLAGQLNRFSSHHKSIERSIFTMHATYKKLPVIEPDIQLMKLGNSLFDCPDLLKNITLYIETTAEILQKASDLKQKIFEEVVDSLSFTRDTPEDSSRLIDE